MCRTDRWRRSAALAPLALALVLAGGAAAQTSFDDGSFAAGAAAQEPEAKGGAWPAAPEGGFGGSFEGGAAEASEGEAAAGGFGGSFDGGDATEAAEGEAPEGGFGGSFEGEAAEATAETPAREPDDVAGEQAAEPEPEAEVEETAEVEPEPEMEADDEASVTPDDDDPILAFEMRDYGVPPTGWLRQGDFHAATPVAVPGATVITTDELADAIDGGDVAFVLVDVLGGEYMLPNALSAPGLAYPGNYTDRTQQQAIVWLAQVTGGNPGVPIVLYCSDPMCWMSYNAALRAVAAGYTNVYWYRGGLQAWQMAGLPVFPSGF